MLRDTTIGQYYPVDSAIHRLDPRTKLAGTFVFLVSLFITKSIIGYILATAALFGCIRLSRVPFKFITKGLKVTKEGLKTAGFMAIRLIYLVIGSSVMTLTTTPTQLTDGLERSLGFLNKLHIPVHEIAMMMAIALRFIPILIEETDKIMKAQQARGADFESGNSIRRARALVPILVPLFVSAFRRAADLANAMEARCYHGGAGRTKMRPLRYQATDHRAYIIMLIYLVLMAATRFAAL